MLIVLGYFGSMIVSQGIYLSHVHEDQQIAAERLAAAQADCAAKSAAVRVIFAASTAMGAGISLAPAKYPFMPARASA